MRYLLLVPIIYIAAVLQTSLGGLLSVGHVGPDLMALAAIVWLLYDSQPRAFLAAAAIGLVADLIAPGRVGLGMACFLLVGYAVCRLRTKLPAEHLVGRATIILIAVGLISMAIGCVGPLLGQASPGLSQVVARSIGVGVYTAGISIPLLMIAGWISEPYSTRHANQSR
jgi:rod shape-determining protein MreD